MLCTEKTKLEDGQMDAYNSRLHEATAQKSQKKDNSRDAFFRSGVVALWMEVIVGSS